MSYLRIALLLLLLLQYIILTASAAGAASMRSSGPRKHAVSGVRSSKSYPITVSPRTTEAISMLVSLIASKFASPLSYDETLLNTWGFKRVGCGKGDFLVADTGMVDNWICANRGEKLVTAAMEEILSAGCRKHDDREADVLFLDVGSNTGFYGLNAISHGCIAAFFDVQPGCNKVVNAALLVNGFADRGVVLAAGLSDRMDFVQASSKGTCSFESGRFPISAIEAGTLEEGDVYVPAVPLSRVLPPSSSTRIFMMKIDTEGLEQRVLSGAMPLFKKKCIEHVIVEVTPGGGFWEKRGVVAADVANTMRDISACGYSFTRFSSKARTTDPKRVHALFSKRNFEQEDFLISRM
jgi:FkbM family methyltransferase